jgi:hypothetical protein
LSIVVEGWDFIEFDEIKCPKILSLAVVSYWVKRTVADLTKTTVSPKAGRGNVLSER